MSFSKRRRTLRAASIPCVIGAMLAFACLAVVPASARTGRVGQAGTSLRMSHAVQARRKVEARFIVQGRHRYRIAVLITSKGAQLVASKRHTAIFYSTSQSRLIANRFEADFGGLGKVDVKFQPLGTDTRGVTSSGCAAQSARSGQHGVFVGSIRFHGESKFTSVSKQHVFGEVRTSGKKNGSCSSQVSAPERMRPQGGYEVKAALERGRRIVLFSAGGKSLAEIKGWESHVGIPLGLPSLRRHGVPFTAVSVERRHGMQIVRLAVAAGVKSTLAVATDGLSATVRPPVPFDGSARISPCSMRGWSGNLRVAFPGLRQPLTGHDFGETLSPQANCGSAATSGR
jgi:hypothetical protein